MTLKKDLDEPTHDLGWKDNVELTEPATLQAEERLR
jgi:hypothetical protein